MASRAYAGQCGGGVWKSGDNVPGIGPSRQSTGALFAEAGNRAGDGGGDLGGEIDGDGDKSPGGTEGGRGIYAAGWELSGGAAGIHDRGCAGIADAGGEGAGEEAASGVGACGGDGWRGSGVGERRGRQGAEWSKWAEPCICDLHIGIDGTAERCGSGASSVGQLCPGH